jgi:hypothetical protein
MYCYLLRCVAMFNDVWQCDYALLCPAMFEDALLCVRKCFYGLWVKMCCNVSGCAVMYCYVGCVTILCYALLRLIMCSYV